MELYFSDRYRIRTLDERNLVFEEQKLQKNKKTGFEVARWVTNGYFSSLSNALSCLIEKKIRDSEARDVKELIKLLEEIKKELNLL